MTPKRSGTHCALDEESKALPEHAMHRQGLSARAHDRILEVARTIADLAGCENIDPKHMSEAINYRRSTTTIGRKYHCVLAKA